MDLYQGVQTWVRYWSQYATRNTSLSICVTSKDRDMVGELWGGLSSQLLTKTTPRPSRSVPRYTAK